MMCPYVGTGALFRHWLDGTPDHDKMKINLRKLHGVIIYSFVQPFFPLGIKYPKPVINRFSRKAAC